MAKNNITQDTIVNIIQNVLQHHTDIDYIIKLSKETLSTYLYMKYNTSVYACRISDHKPNKYRSMRSMLISNKTKASAIERYIINTIKMLKNRSFYNTINNINVNNEHTDDIDIEQFNSIIEYDDLDTEFLEAGDNDV